ncbi:GNAT family N-acetyltransferase [Catellatospora chokoriensis]|uniref:Cellulose biosynthesis protein CelD n=1 Tax=Catellatospora chokoriensis TaxID=310353 RepID=A0A8J3JLR6_9ACTN|nr:GNAT family N-acetyltransferase [Catellatospora chokoriensis]GIF87197.1 cellulose biosynthesis protein CelD [Catellatospora chokoriensis]
MTPTANGLVPLQHLADQDISAWHRIRAGNPLLDSPYFHPDFARAVHDSGSPVHVYVERGPAGDATLLLPCHVSGGLLRPVGWPGADFQGPIAAPDTPFRPLDLIAGRVRGYSFDHLLTGVDRCEPWIESRQPSPYLEIGGALPGYLERASSAGRRKMTEARRLVAMAERNLGPLRFAADTVDHDELARVIELKRAQYASTGAPDYFAEPSRVALVHGLLDRRDPAFGGMLSTVYAGDQLLAAHFGIRADSVLHWWFPVYDPALGQLSPGWILLREIIMRADELGITRIDLGRGDDDFKRRAKTGEVEVCQGLVTRSSTRLAARRLQRRLVAAAKTSPLGPQLRQISRRLRGRA